MLVQILLVGSLLAPDGALRTVRLRLNHLGEDGEASALVVLVVHRHLRLLHLRLAKKRTTKLRSSFVQIAHISTAVTKSIA